MVSGVGGPSAFAWSCVPVGSWSRLGSPLLHFFFLLSGSVAAASWARCCCGCFPYVRTPFLLGRCSEPPWGSAIVADVMCPGFGRLHALLSCLVMP